MKLEIRPVKVRATCCYNCITYQDHPDWMMSLKLGRRIPIGETALVVTGTDRNFCLCHKHAMEYLVEIKNMVDDVFEQAQALGWKNNVI